MQEVIERGKRSKPVKNINKNPQSFLKISPTQKEVLLSYKLQEHAYE